MAKCDNCLTKMNIPKRWSNLCYDCSYPKLTKDEKWDIANKEGLEEPIEFINETESIICDRFKKRLRR